MKNKILVISDIHGRDNWINTTQKYINSVDKVVFLGDYFDSFDIRPNVQIDNFNKIIEFKKQNLDKVVLLIGNHDYHYLGYTNSKYSGFSYFYKQDIYDALINNINLLQICYVNGNVIFSHAGLSAYWLKLAKIKYENLNELQDSVNRILIKKPEILDFGWLRPTNKSLTTLHPNPYGDNIFQGPLWIRPKSLYSNDSVISNTVQVVGHTHNNGIFVKSLSKFNSKVVLTDVYDIVNISSIIEIENGNYVDIEVIY